MLGDEFLVKGFETGRGASFDILTQTARSQQIHSDIIGDFSATTYAFIEPAAQKKIFAKMLPFKYQSKPEMQQALLKELANILVAGFVTKVSELLSCNIYGHIPTLTTLSLHEIKTLAAKNDAFVCRFHGLRQNLKIEFLCVFEPDIERIVWHSHWEADYLLYRAQENRGLGGFFKWLFS